MKSTTRSSCYEKHKPREILPLMYEDSLNVGTEDVAFNFLKV
jgi:hypothetical protein